MAYFPNGTTGEAFDEQCSICRGHNKPCPVAMAQLNYNYESVNNEVVTGILSMLVDDNGTCKLFEFFRKELELSEDEKNQLELF